jgi:hypothetical protein
MEGRIMTQNAPEQSTTYTQEEVSSAESAEQAALSKAQNQYLTQRVVVLRAQLDRAKRDIEALRNALSAIEVPDAEPVDPEETPESDPENSPEG